MVCISIPTYSEETRVQRNIGNLAQILQEVPDNKFRNLGLSDTNPFFGHLVKLPSFLIQLLSGLSYANVIKD